MLHQKREERWKTAGVKQERIQGEPQDSDVGGITRIPTRKASNDRMWRTFEVGQDGFGGVCPSDSDDLCACLFDCLLDGFLLLFFACFVPVRLSFHMYALTLGL